ncbi:transcription initiation factor IIA subunit 1 isoform X2 [Planococcus citri]|uniref:transcription initiation factor IIA subunit 1 isoform X2 n=1 Tax=Planococcus citri TaxID=170843 RepID=UPI0031F77DC8
MSFLSSVNQTTVVKFYSNVMDDVLAGVREAFLDEGVDEQVLQELRQMWEAKVLASKAIDPPEIVEPQPPPLQVSQPQNEPNRVHQQTNGTQQPMQSSSSPKNKPSTSVNNQQNVMKQFTPAPSQTINLTNTAVTDLNNKMVPISLTLPPPSGSQNTQPRVYSLQVPASALQSDQLQRILTAPVISATMSLPESVASNLLQQHVTAALQGQASVIPTATNNTGGAQNLLIPQNSNRQFPHMNQISGNISQVDGACDVSDDEGEPSTNTTSLNEEPVNFSITVLDKIHQVDGIYDTSDDDDEDDDDDDDDIDDDDDDDDDDNKDEEENEEAENGVEEDPLNSEDDVSEGDNTDLFDTDNVVVCQYDKINRSRNKWKFYLKDGIMNLSGRDYIFQKANGDAEW